MSALKEKILRRIAQEGPLTIAQYMQMALGDPEHGYYRKHDPFGAAGDFVTAPEVSQIFGELIGLWFVQAWGDRGWPKKFYLVELGPGRGTLMADMLRAAKIRLPFLAAAEIILVETSPILRQAQQRALQGTNTRWIDEIAGIPGDAPILLVANEFLDALPIRQFIMAEGHWHERMVTAKGNALAFALAPMPADFTSLPKQAPESAVAEIPQDALAAIGGIAARLKQQSGAALFIDYGHTQSGLGDTFQGVKAHKFADPLAKPGEADLTAHVDFEALAKRAQEMGVLFLGTTAQGKFLEALGIHARAARLKQGADPATRAEIDAAVDRLVNPAQMGTLFKVMAVVSQGARTS